MKFGRIWVVVALLMTCLTAWGQGKRKIIIDQDAAGPGGTDQQSILLLIQSPQTDVLGVTVVTGDAWLKSEVAHTLRMNSTFGSIRKRHTSCCARPGKRSSALR